MDRGPGNGMDGNGLLSFRLNLMPGIDRSAAWLVCSCIAPVRYPPLLGATQGEEISDEPILLCPSSKTGTRRNLCDTDPVDRFCLHDLDGWGQRVQEAWRSARFGRVSIFFRAVCRTWPRGARYACWAASFWGRAVFRARQSKFERACDSACMFAGGCTPNFSTPESV